MGVIELLANDNYITVNKMIAKKLGLTEAVLLGELASEFKYWKNREELTEDGFFYSTVENVIENTTLSDRQQRTAVKNLKAAGVLEVKLKGLPAKRYFKFNEEQLMQIMEIQLFQNESSSYDKTQELDIPKTQEIELTNTQGNNNNLKIFNNKNNKQDKKKESKKGSFYAIIADYTNDEVIIDLLQEWLKVRKAKRAAMTDRAIKMNIDKLDDLAKQSEMTVKEYLSEVICRGWAAFYEIKQYGSTPQKQASGGNVFLDIAKEEGLF